MFFNRRREYNGKVSAMLPGLGVDMERAGTLKVLDTLDLAWQQRLSVCEAALMVAYAYVGGLYQHGLVTLGDAVLNEKIGRVQKEWIKLALVRPEVIAKWPQLTLKRRPSDAGPGSSDEGRSAKSPIAIAATSSGEGVLAEYLCITKRHGISDEDWELISQEVGETDGRMIDTLRIKLRTGEELVYYFDITSFYGRWE